MKIKYAFLDGTVTEVEVSDEIGAVIIDSRKAEHAQDERHRYHCYSYDAIDYEGEEYLCMTAPIDILAVFSWLKNPYKNTKEVLVNKINKKQVIIMFSLAFAVTFVFYFILKALNTAQLLFSTISITTSFLPCYLTYLRSPYYALGYAANDIVLIILWSFAAAQNIAYLSMIFCFVMFLANDIYGFINWKRMFKKQAYNI